MLQLVFGDQEEAATAKRELLKLQQKDHMFSQYYAEFQRYVADVKWNTEAQMDALRNGLSNQLKDSLEHADMPDIIVDFVKMCSKCD
jgi:HKD family nuclease